MEDRITIKGKKYQKLYQNMFGYKEYRDKDGRLVREACARPLVIVPYEKTYIMGGELYGEVDEFSDDNLV